MKLAKISVVVLTILIFCFTIYKFELSKVSNNDETKEFIVDAGDTYLTIGKKLENNKLIKSELFYKIYVKLNKPSELKSGKYMLNESMGVKKIINTLSKGSTYNPDTITITFIEGKNMRNIAKTIADNTNNTVDEVFDLLKDEDYIDSLVNDYWFITSDIKNKKIYYPLEGYLFMDTYEFLNKDVSVKEIFKTMLDKMDKELSKYKEEITKSKYSIHELLTLASIVELEEFNKEDRSDVAGVFYNRIEDNWTLGSDVTTYYAEKEDNWDGLSTKQLNACNAYNTRGTCFNGLPVGPISNPSLESIIATIKPNKHNYFYFAHDCKGEIYLTRTEREHDNIINKLREENNWCA